MGLPELLNDIWRFKFLSELFSSWQLQPKTPRPKCEQQHPIASKFGRQPTEFPVQRPRTTPYPTPLPSILLGVERSENANVIAMYERANSRQLHLDLIIQGRVRPEQKQNKNGELFPNKNEQRGLFCGADRADRALVAPKEDFFARFFNRRLQRAVRRKALRMV